MIETFPPITIAIHSDDSVMKFQSFNEKSKIYIYQYSFSIGDTKTGNICPFTEDGLRKFLATNKLFQRK